MRVGIAPGHSYLAPSPQDWEHAICVRAVAHLADLLDDAGHDVVLAAYSDLDNDAALRARVEHFNATRCDVALELHLNAGRGDYGTAIYWSAGGERFSVRGHQLAQHCAAAIGAAPVSGLSAHAMSSATLDRDLLFLSGTRMPAVIVEPAFMDGPPAHRAWIRSDPFPIDYAAICYLAVQRYACLHQ